MLGAGICGTTLGGELLVLKIALVCSGDERGGGTFRGVRAALPTPPKVLFATAVMGDGLMFC